MFGFSVLGFVVGYFEDFFGLVFVEKLGVVRVLYSFFRFGRREL